MKRVLVVTSALVLLAAVLFGVVYSATRSSGSSSSQSVLRGLLSTTDLLSADAALMREHGQRIADIGQRAREPQWIDQGTDLVESAERMESLADQLRRTERDLALFPPATSGDIFRLRADGDALVEVGQGLLDDGREMSEAADAMAAAERVAGQAELGEGAVLLRTNAEMMIRDGGFVLQVGKSLRDQADLLERSLGH